MASQELLSAQSQPAMSRAQANPPQHFQRFGASSGSHPIQRIGRSIAALAYVVYESDSQRVVREFAINPTRGTRAMVVLLGAAVTVGALPAKAQYVLGGRAACDASAALIVDCPDGVGRCLLVGDNEVRLDLFLYRLDGDGRPAARSSLAARLKLNSEDEVSDIEALTQSAAGRLLVFGSHSRSSVCDAKKKRRRFGSIKANDEAGQK